MKASETTSEPKSALSHPCFWIALALLGLNDHLFKGSGALPAWLTGKVSDFSGMIVAPVVCAELCRGPLRRLRPFAPWCVAAGFAATELVPACAHAVELAATRLGLHARLWPDASDLLALLMLPLALRLLRRGGRAATLRFHERLALASGLLLCVATTNVRPYTRGPFLVNQSDQGLSLTLRWLSVPDACNASSSALRQAAARSGSTEYSMRLESMQVAKLAQEPSASQPIVGICPSSEDTADAGDSDTVGAGGPATPCVVVAVSGAKLKPTLVRAARFWLNDSSPSRCRARMPLYEDPGEGAVRLISGSSGNAELRANGRIELVPID